MKKTLISLLCIGSILALPGCGGSRRSCDRNPCHDDYYMENDCDYDTCEYGDGSCDMMGGHSGTMYNNMPSSCTADEDTYNNGQRISTNAAQNKNTNKKKQPSANKRQKKM